MKTPSVEVNGTKDGHGYRIVIDGNIVNLSGGLFTIFTLLALERYRNDKTAEGWITTKALDVSTVNASRYMWQLRKAIRDGLAGTAFVKWAVVENAGGGRYRLVADPTEITFPNPEALIAFEHHSITSRLRGPGRIELRDVT